MAQSRSRTTFENENTMYVVTRGCRNSNILNRVIATASWSQYGCWYTNTYAGIFVQTAVGNIIQYCTGILCGFFFFLFFFFALQILSCTRMRYRIFSAYRILPYFAGFYSKSREFSCVFPCFRIKHIRNVGRMHQLDGTRRIFREEVNFPTRFGHCLIFHAFRGERMHRIAFQQAIYLLR